MKLNNEQVKALVNIVSHYTGFKFPDGLNAELLSHLESGLAHINKDPEELIGLVERFSFNPVRVLELIQPILDEVLIGETYFFRDYEAYDLLAAEVLPELVKQFGAYKRSLRVWSAGCSSGEEAYSLSIFLNKYFAGKDWQIDILGTDLNKSRLEKARQAVYGLNSFRHQSRFKEAFTPVEGRGNLQVKEEYRRNVQFKCLNLLENTSQPLKTDLYMYDLIFCRNVFIYFDQKTIKAVAKRLYQTLAPGGFLVITPSEYSKELFEDFEIIDTVNYRILRRPLLVKNEFPVSPKISRINAEKVQAHLSINPTSQPEIVSEISPLEEKLVKDPLNSALYLHLVALYQEQNAPVKALEMARKYVYLEPHKPEGYFYLINLEAQVGNKQRQARAYNRIISILENSNPAERSPNLPSITYGELLNLVRAGLKEIQYQTEFEN